MFSCVTVYNLEEQLTPLQILLIETKNDSRGCGYLKKFEQ